MFAYPKPCEFGRIVSKAKIFASAKPNAAMREKFTEQITQIRWSHKLYEKGLNLAGSANVPEIQIFTIALKTKDYDENILRHIDKAIGYPIIFELRYKDEINMAAAYKRPPETGSGKWIIGDYYRGGWQQADAERLTLPTALNLEALYGHMIRALMPVPARAGESLSAQAERIAAIRTQKKTCQNLKSKVNKEKQFNRRVEFNQKLKAAKNILAALVGE
ncbi:MAG: DUF4391 domain-containing protein [Robiginitomaculum sp.]|nr:DUF4391 domain-containing protein [Robiginitomaculum sp.]